MEGEAAVELLSAPRGGMRLHDALVARLTKTLVAASLSLDNMPLFNTPTAEACWRALLLSSPE